MGLLQSHVGHGGRYRQARLNDPAKAITVHSLRQAKAAAAAAADTGRPVLLLSAPGAAGTVGPAWFDAVLRIASRASPDAEVDGVLDCGDMPGYALSALRHGLKAIRYDGPGFDAISDIAGQLGAAVLRERPDSLDLAGRPEDPAALAEACRNWLLGAPTAGKSS
jgi:hypothetical protein